MRQAREGLDQWADVLRASAQPDGEIRFWSESRTPLADTLAPVLKVFQGQHVAAQLDAALKAGREDQYQGLIVSAVALLLQQLTNLLESAAVLVQKEQLGVGWQVRCEVLPVANSGMNADQGSWGVLVGRG